MVVDTSVLLAVVFEEARADWAVEKLALHSRELRMCTVTLAETLILIRDRQPQLYDDIEAQILNLGIRFVPPTVETARIAAEARLRLPLDLGDCFAYALARVEQTPLLTLDAGFRAIDHDVLMPD